MRLKFSDQTAKDLAKLIKMFNDPMKAIGHLVLLNKSGYTVEQMYGKHPLRKWRIAHVIQS